MSKTPLPILAGARLDLGRLDERDDLLFAVNVEREVKLLAWVRTVFSDMKSFFAMDGMSYPWAKRSMISCLRSVRAKRRASAAHCFSTQFAARFPAWSAATSRNPSAFQALPEAGPACVSQRRACFAFAEYARFPALRCPSCAGRRRPPSSLV